MTVTISSTTDTEADVRAAVGHTATEPDPAPVPEDTAPVEEAVETAPEADAIEETPGEDEAPPEPVEAAGELVENDDDTEPAEPAVAATDEPEEDVDVDAAPEEPPKKKRRRRGRSYKDRASQLAREKASEVARADALEARLADIERQRQVAPVPNEVPDPNVGPVEVAPDAGRPDQSQFETYEAFQEALVDWKVSQRIDAHERERAVRMESDQKHQRQREVVAAHVARIDVFRETHPDFDAVVEKAKDLPVTAPMHDAVLNSEHGAAVMYHLCQNPEECDRIAQMHPLSAIKEIGRLEARLDVARSTTGPTPKAEPVTKAPRPIKPVGGGVTASTVPLDQMNYQDYKRAREREIALAQGLPDPFAGVHR